MAAPVSRFAASPDAAADKLLLSRFIYIEEQESVEGQSSASMNVRSEGRSLSRKTSHALHDHSLPQTNRSPLPEHSSEQRVS